MNSKYIFLILFIFVLRSDGRSYFTEHAKSFEKFKQYVDSGGVWFSRYTTYCGRTIIKHVTTFCRSKEIEDDVKKYIDLRNKLEDEIATKAIFTGFALGGITGFFMPHWFKSDSSVGINVVLALPLPVLLYFKNKFKSPGTNDRLDLQKNMMGFFTERFWKTGFIITVSEWGGIIVGILGVETLKKFLRRI